MAVTNTRLTDEEFAKERKEVLASWKTGQEVDLDEAIAYHKSQPENKNYAIKLTRAKKAGELLLSSDMGYTTLQQEIELLQYIQNEGYSDFLGNHVDSLTRNLHFKEAEEQLRKSESTGKSLLNGFPIVAHGVKGCRTLVESVKLPVRLRFVAPTGKLVTEIALAGGHTYAEAHPVACFMNYSNEEQIETVIREFQYICRLIGVYEAKGVPIMAHAFGGNHLLSMTPPSLMLALSIVDALLLPEQGVKNINITMGSQGNLAQDIAYCKATEKLGNEYLKKLGYNDVNLFVGGAEMPGRYPQDHAQAFSEVIWSPIISVLAGVDACHIKTIDEADTIPNKENSAFSLRGARMMINMLKDQKIDISTNKDIKQELEMIEKETRLIVDKVLEMGDSDPVLGAIKGVEAGVLDHPVASNKHVHCVVVGVRDIRGAVRYMEHGGLPFTREILEFHKEKLADREKATGKKVNYDSVVSDFLTISRSFTEIGPRFMM